MSVLLIAEHNNKELRPFTLNAATAASQIDADVHAVIIGQNCGDAAKALSELPLVKKVIHVEAPYYENFVAENFAPVIVKLAENYSHIVSSANTFGKNLMPRIAALLDTSQISDITKVISADTFLRPIYAGNAFATVKTKDNKKCITIRPTSFDTCESTGGSAPIEKGEPSEEFSQTKFIKREEIKSDRPELGTARVVVSGGRGLKGPEHWHLIEDLADTLGAATACSKPVSDMGWRPHSEHVGQTGKPVASNLYIAIGVSGAIQHLAGVNSSKVKVVINNDPEAPFFKAADYGIVGDAFEVVPALTEKLKARKKI